VDVINQLIEESLPMPYRLMKGTIKQLDISLPDFSQLQKQN